MIYLGNGWLIDTSDKHFRLKYNNAQKFVVHNDGHAWSEKEEWFKDMLRSGNAVTIRSQRSGNRLQEADDINVAAVNGKYARPARFDNKNQGEWEKMYLERI